MVKCNKCNHILSKYCDAISGKELMVCEYCDCLATIERMKKNGRSLESISRQEKRLEKLNETIVGDALIATEEELNEPEDDGEIDEDVAGAKQNGER